MYIKGKLMKAASVCLYIGSAFWFLVCACAFSLDNSRYWLYLVLALASLCDGFVVTSVREKMTNVVLEPAETKKYLVCWLVSIVFLPAFVLNALAYLRQKEDGLTLVRQETAPVKKARPAAKHPLRVVVLCVSLAVIFAASFAAMLFETSCFQVKVTDFTLTKAMTEQYNTQELNGQSCVIQNDELHYAVTMYVPRTATAETPAATVFVIPGFTRTKATMAQYCIELSRRGAVVFCIDPGCQGGTTYAGYDGDGKQVSATVQANGLSYLVQYVYNNTDDFDFVDRGRFGVVGHSAGGGNVVTTAAKFAGESYEESVIKAAYISGYIKVSSANNYSKLNCNAALSYAYYDEGAFRYQTDDSAFEVIALRFINEVGGAPNRYDKVAAEYGYGDMSNGTYRIIHRERINHCFEMYDKASIANTIDFFDAALSMGSGLPGDHQTWLGKELFNGIALVAGFAFVLALSAVLLKTPFFAAIKEKASRAAPVPVKPATVSHKIIFWFTMLLTAIIACLDYIPLASWSMSLFADAASNTYTYFFPARMVNAVLLWAGVNGLIGLLLFFVVTVCEDFYEASRARSRGETPARGHANFRPLKMSGSSVLKTLLLAVLLFGAFYVLVQLCYGVFHQDFRFMLISAAPLQPRFVVTWLMYLPIFFIFYISNSIRVNCSIGTQGWPEWKVMLVGGLANSIGLVFILIINYVRFFVTGSVYYGYWDAGKEVWLYINMVFPLVVMMFLLPIFNRLYYKQSGNVLLGAVANCLIFIMMLLSASVSYIPM